jgi:phosphopantothenoylcysteine synthetase/decarboxylase
VTSDLPSQILSIVVCGAPPAAKIAIYAKLAIDRGWTVHVIATPAALAFFDQASVEALTGNPVRSQNRPPDTPRSQTPDAVVVAPATYNTINKWALGIADTYALSMLAEKTGMDIPIVVLPYLNAPLANRTPFQQSVKSLRAEGVSILLGPGGFEPPDAPPDSTPVDNYPWHLALDEAESMLGTAANTSPVRPPL